MIDFPLTKPAKTNILYYSVCNNSVIITVGTENSNVRRSLILNLGIFRGCTAKAAAVFFIFTGLIITHPQDSMAAARTEVQTRSSYMVTIEAPSVDVYTYKSKSSGKLGQVRRGQTYEVLAKGQDGWVRIRMGNREGYIITPGNATLVEKNRRTVDSGARERRQVVEFALQFLGGAYVYGGADPNTGVDCSGFTRYIMKHAASIDIPHSAKGQAACGAEVSVEDMQPGDLIFYSSENEGIDHVAMYIGGSQVVHASTEETGIKLSPYNYREPVKVVSVLR